MHRAQIALRLGEAMLASAAPKADDQLELFLVTWVQGVPRRNAALYFLDEQGVALSGLFAERISMSAHGGGPNFPTSVYSRSLF
eukprot:CAMPEP_0172618236 /NCGR_PEP_ID=MMETSP1068-20121228/78028_1 /TAXON_ID=35684 /ORGANISM="Pseudopedinella elastica, Strain CCMP716" /LENGTH=83 /DNA_ID=CAMNT_0013424335 /DNA_START=212 /DNA_END=463 /DNA_ORIENTATION=+